MANGEILSGVRPASVALESPLTLVQGEEMHNFCKAYRLQDLRQFAGWSEKSGTQVELGDHDIVYLWDDYTVVRTPIHNKGVIFDTVTPEWEQFCRQTLNFQVPAEVPGVPA